MYFTVATGYVIGNFRSLLQLVFQEINVHGYEEDIEQITEIHELFNFLEETKIEFKMYPDIIDEGDNFFMYKYDRDIPKFCLQRARI